MPDPVLGRDFIYDFYAMLGLDKEASPAQIRKAYQQKLAEYHPDRYGQAAPEYQHDAQEASRVLNLGYSILSSSSKRQAYDQLLQQWTGPIAQTHVPVISLSFSGHLLQQFSDTIWDDICQKIDLLLPDKTSSITELSQQIAHLSAVGMDTTTLDKLLYDLKKDQLNNIKAKEAQALDFMGLKQPMLHSDAQQYLEVVTGQMQAEQQRLLTLGQGANSQLALEAGLMTASSDQAATASPDSSVVDKGEAIQATTLRYSQQRLQATEDLFDSAQHLHHYHPSSNRDGLQIVACLMDKDQVVFSLAFIIADDLKSADADDSLSLRPASQDNDWLKQFLDQGWSILMTDYDAEVAEPVAQLTAALNFHISQLTKS